MIDFVDVEGEGGEETLKLDRFDRVKFKKITETKVLSIVSSNNLNQK